MSQYRRYRAMKSVQRVEICRSAALSARVSEGYDQHLLAEGDIELFWKVDSCLTHIDAGITRPRRCFKRLVQCYP